MYIFVLVSLPNLATFLSKQRCKTRVMNDSLSHHHLQVWVEAIKKILQQQFELLKALKQPAPSARHRSQTLGPATFMLVPLYIPLSLYCDITS